MARILCLDDDPLILAVMVRTLGELGHEVVTVGNGRGALEVGASQPFEIAFVDYDLQEALDGLAVLRSLRGLQPACMRVLMTGGRSSAMFVDAVNEGEVARVLSKPFRAEDVRVAITAVLEVARHQSAATRTRVAEASAQIHVHECMSKSLFRIALQPIVDLSTGAVVAAECLLRAHHPVLNTAMRVIGAAELSGHLFEVGECVFDLAAECQARFQNLQLFVNVHPLQFGDPELLLRLKPLLDGAGRVVLEITERSDLQAIPDWEGVFAQLSEAGFQFAVDDLGAGYSNLALLSDLRPAYIKVDMSIVRDVHLHTRKQRLIEMLVGFANATGSRLVAEGVESIEEARTLLTLGTHLAQGYYFARPTFDWPPAPCDSWLELTQLGA